MNEQKSAKIISVINHKGGVGKTTTAFHIAACLKEMGKKVLAIDLDPQGNLSSVAREPGKTFKYKIDHLLKQEVPLNDAIIHLEAFDLIPADLSLIETRTWIASQKIGRDLKLAKVVEHARALYDYIIVDNQPDLSDLTTNSLMASNYFILVVQTDEFSRDGTKNVMDFVELIREFNPTLKFLGTIANKFDSRTTMDNEVLAQFRTAFVHPADDKLNYLFTTVIRQAVAIAEARSERKSIVAYAPQSSAAEQYRALMGELLERTEQLTHG